MGGNHDNKERDSNWDHPFPRKLGYYKRRSDIKEVDITKFIVSYKSLFLIIFFVNIYPHYVSLDLQVEDPPPRMGTLTYLISTQRIRRVEAYGQNGFLGIVSWTSEPLGGLSHHKRWWAPNRNLVDKRSSSQSQVVPCPWDFAWTLVPRPGPPHPTKIFSPGTLVAGGRATKK